VDHWSAVISMTSLCQCLHWPSALPVSGLALCTLVHQFVVLRRHCRCTGWRALALAIVLVTVPPKGGIYNGQVFQVWSSEDALVMAPILPFTLLRRGVTDDGDEPFLGPKGPVSKPSEKSSLSSEFCLRSYSQMMTLYSALTSPY
jgi:hypothetical protein